MALPSPGLTCTPAYRPRRHTVQRVNKAISTYDLGTGSSGLATKMATGAVIFCRRWASAVDAAVNTGRYAGTGRR